MKVRLIVLLTCVWLACGGCPTAPQYVEGNPRARISTTLGEFVIELDQTNAPLTVQNFQQYVQDGFYDGTLFHRIVPGFVVQGGGFSPGMELKPTRDPIVNESNNGLKNVRGSVAMARTDDPASATSQFYVNLANNASLDATLTSPGYAVFGQVVEGMTVIDQIAAVPTETRGDFADVPVTDIVIQSVTIEPGERVLSPEWQTYTQDYQYSVANGLRDVAVEILGALIAGG